MGADQGAESALWAATAKEVEEDPAKYQGAYLRQPDDSVSRFWCFTPFECDLISFH